MSPIFSAVVDPVYVMIPSCKNKSPYLDINQAWPVKQLALKIYCNQQREVKIKGTKIKGSEN